MTADGGTPDGTGGAGADVFTEPEDPSDDWVDVRMTAPEKGEWDVDVIVANSTVQYVDLRVRPGLLESFIECLVEDVGASRASEILRRVAESQGLDIDGHESEE